MLEPPAGQFQTRSMNAPVARPAQTVLQVAIVSVVVATDFPGKCQEFAEL